VAKFFWVVTIIMSLFGGLFAIVGIHAANGAPQEAASAAIGLACAVIPYCIARAIGEMRSLD
jgi:sugar phosphate permease